MAKPKGRPAGKRKGQKKKTQQDPGRQIVERVGRSILTNAERAYASLLNDPCNAPTANITLGDGTSGTIQRFENDFIMSTDASITTIALCYQPGVPVIRHAYANAGTDAANLTWASGFTAPGSATLGAAERYRCLAACMQVFWAGAETDRQGYIAMGNATGGASNGVTTTPAELRTALPYALRFPDTHAGIKWRPHEDDLSFTTIGLGNQHSSIYMVISGLPANTPIRVRCVGVYEYQNGIALGGGTVLAQYGDSTVTHPNLWRKALGALDRTGHWLLDNAESIVGAAAKTATVLKG